MDNQIKGLVEMADEYGTLRTRFLNAASRHIDAAALLSDEEFWPLVGELAKELAASKTHPHYRTGKVVEEFVRSRLFDRQSSIPSYDRDHRGLANEQLAIWEKLASFARTYEKAKGRVYRLCDKFPDLGRGDDSFGDFCDSFVLAGKEMLDSIEDGRIATMKQVEMAVADHPLRDFMLHGENYVVFTLERNLAKKLPSVARDLLVVDEAPID